MTQVTLCAPAQLLPRARKCDAGHTSPNKQENTRAGSAQAVPPRSPPCSRIDRPAVKRPRVRPDLRAGARGSKRASGCAQRIRTHMVTDAERMRAKRARIRAQGIICGRCCKRRRAQGHTRCRKCLTAAIIHAARADARRRLLASALAREVALADDRVASLHVPRKREPSLQWAFEVRDTLEM